MKTLYLLRHAKAEAAGKDITDPQRTLSARGREACEVVGAYMKSRAYGPAFVLCSPSARTKETLELVSKAAGISPKYRYEEALYLASAQEILHTIQSLAANVPSAMIVGHNPGMHHIALLLGSREPTQLRTDLELKYPTGALTVLRFDCEKWKEVKVSQGTLTDFVMPGEL